MTQSCSGAFQEDRRTAEGESQLVRRSGRFPLSGRGDVNTYPLFAELDRQLIATSGRVGIIIPSGIASDDTTKVFFQDLIRTRALVSLHSFENEEFLFPAVHHSTKFCLITLTGPQHSQESSDFVFFTRRTEQLQENDRHFILSAEEIRLMNPNTGTCPIFRSKRDAEINKAIYRRVPVLIREGSLEENPWGTSFMAMLHMANDSGLFRTREQLEADSWSLKGNRFRRGDRFTYLSTKPRWSTTSTTALEHTRVKPTRRPTRASCPTVDDTQHADPFCLILPWYWVPETKSRPAFEELLGPRLAARLA